MPWLNPVRAAAVLAALSTTLLAAPRARAADHTLRIATMAPKNSSWGKVFKVWRKAIKKKSDGKLDLTIYYNAVQGGDDAMVGKMRSGQLDGAALTAVGLSRINRDVLALQLPGIVDSWSVLDKVRTALRPEIEGGFEKHGFRVLSWGDIGLVRQMSRGFAVHRPSDLKGKHPLVWRNEPVGPVVFSTIGGVVPVPLGPMEVLPALRAGKVDVINAPALAAEQLQWVPYLDHVSGTVTVCAIGGMVFRAKAIDDMPADLREIFLDIQKRLDKGNSHRVRQLDDASFARIKKKMTVVDITAADREAWRKVLVRAVKQIAQGTLDKALIKRVVQLSGKSENG